MSLSLLSWVHEMLGRHAVTRRRLPARVLQTLGRTWLRSRLLRDELSRPNDITVVIGVRNRADYRLMNALRSIRSQTHPAELIRILVVDFGSDADSARRVKAMCDENRAKYVRVDDASLWSRSRCLNVGIRLADTKLVMTSDVDVLLSPRYLSDAVRLLEETVVAVVCSAMLDLHAGSAEALERAAREGRGLQLDAWRGQCTPRYGWESHPSVCVSYTALYKAVRGLDEYYEVWGAEDDDMMRRLTYLGVQRTVVGSESFYLHQWHPDADRAAGVESTERNRAHFAKSHSIIRNGTDWGSGRHHEAHD